jgi:hypothetical protein
VAEAAETAARTVEGRTAESARKEAKNSACQKQQRQQHDSRRKSSRIGSNRGENCDCSRKNTAAEAAAELTAVEVNTGAAAAATWVTTTAV